MKLGSKSWIIHSVCTVALGITMLATGADVVGGIVLIGLGLGTAGMSITKYFTDEQNKNEKTLINTSTQEKVEVHKDHSATFNFLKKIFL